MKVAFLQKDLGGVLSHTMVSLPSDGARWDDSPAPTVTLYDSSGGRILAAASADLGPSTTVDADAAAGGKTIPLTATTSIKRWDEYKVGPNATGQYEWVTVDAIASGVSVTVLNELKHTYADGDTFESHTMTDTISGSNVTSLRRNARAEWAYTVDGVQRKESTIFHVGLYVPRYGLTEEEVLGVEPRARHFVGSDQPLDRLIRWLFERELLPDISKIYNPGAIVSGEQLDKALLYKLREYMADAAIEGDGEVAKSHAESYVGAIDELANSLLDVDEDGAAEDEPPRGAMAPRLLRS